jgi:hypothetical protein
MAVDRQPAKDAFQKTAVNCHGGRCACCCRLIQHCDLRPRLWHEDSGAGLVRLSLRCVHDHAGEQIEARLDRIEVHKFGVV